MIIKMIKLETIDDVKEFNKIVNMSNFEAELSLGKYIVDAKSIMGIFSLDLSQQLELSVHSESCSEFLEEIDKFIVK